MKKQGRIYRHNRIRKSVFGSKERFRLVVFRSKNHIYCQLVNDISQKVIAGVSSLSKEFKDKSAGEGNKEKAKALGNAIARKAAELGVKKVCFDRAGYKYHGRVKALADGAREGGLGL